MISDTQDGTFFVRDSSQKGTYALTVKIGHTIRHVLIIFSNHKYGLREPTTFNSVAALVAHYREVPVRSGIALMTHPFSKVKKNVCLCFSIYLCSQGYALKKLYAYTFSFYNLVNVFVVVVVCHNIMLFCCCFLFPPKAC